MGWGERREMADGTGVGEGRGNSLQLFPQVATSVVVLELFLKKRGLKENINIDKSMYYYFDVPMMS